MIDNDARISPRYALLVPGWLKWFVAILIVFILVVLIAVSVAVLVEGSLWGLATLGVAAGLALFTSASFRVFRDPTESYVELTEEGLVVRPLVTLVPPVSVPYSEIESSQLATGCGWFLQYPYPLSASHVDVRLTRARIIHGNRFLRLVKTLHLNVDETERFLSELSARTGR